MVGGVVLEGGFAPSPPLGARGPGFQFSVASEVGLGVEWAFWLTRRREVGCSVCGGASTSTGTGLHFGGVCCDGVCGVEGWICPLTPDPSPPVGARGAIL